MSDHGDQGDKVPVIIEEGERYPHLNVFQPKDWLDGGWPCNETYDGPEDAIEVDRVMYLPAAVVAEWEAAMSALRAAEKKMRTHKPSAS